MIKKYAVEDNCWAKLETSIDATATKIRIKETHNLPQSWEWIATLSKKQGDEIIKMEKVLVVKRELNLLTVQRGFQSTAQAWEENDVLNLYITAEIIREIQRGFDKKADLVNGKVPASQLPEVSQIDESNLVHKSWDEVIRWNKTFKDAPSLATDIGWDTNITLTKFHDVRWSKIRILFKRWSWTSENPRPANVWDVMGALNFDDAVDWKSYFGIEVRKGQGKGKTFISESDLHIWWNSPIDIHVNDQNRTSWRERYTPTLSWDTWWGATFSDTQGRYKVIGKICYVQVRGIIWNKGTCSWAFKVSLPKLAIDRFSIPLAWWIQSIWGHIWTPKAVPLLYRDQIRLAGVLWGHRDTTRSEISVNDFFVFNWCYEIE